MNPYLIDTHCHLHFPAYDEDREAALSRMREKRIAAVTIGTSLENSLRGIEFAEKHSDIWATVGLHPSHVTSPHLDEQEGSVHEHDVDPIKLKELAQSSKKIVAIGEAGLDFYRLEDQPDKEAAKREQERVFRIHLLVAHECDLPVVIHCRDGLTRLAEIIQEQWTAGWKPRAIVHSFTGTWEEAQPLLDLGLMIAVNGIATFPLRKSQDPSTAIDRTIKNIPLSQLLLETDSPYLAPIPYRGKRNEPSYIEEVAKHAAKIRGESVESIAEATTKNALEMFRL
jgi:TatD DNase family protein